MNDKIKKRGRPKTVTPAVIQAAVLPKNGFLRIFQIVGSKKKGVQGLIPISRTSFLNGVKTGIYPAPIKLGERTTAWRAEDIRSLIEKIGGV